MSIPNKLNIKSKIRNYSVLFTEDFGEGWRTADKNLFFIIDQKVAQYYKKELEDILKNRPHLIIEALETHKTLDYAKVVIKHLIDKGVKKDQVLAAVGGGIIQDIVGFVASIFYRGVDWIFYPTTLLAQSDSCIGSKTSINVDEYKNQVGNFYPPLTIYLNVKYLKTLSPVDIKSGLGEIIKVHLLDGENSFKFILDNYDRALEDAGIMNELIYRSLKIKKRVIEKDEFDTDYRKIMNYGHTFGHALESLTNYKLCHGQAVTVGMDISNYLSYRLGYISENIYLKMKKLLLKNWPDYDLKQIDLEPFYRSLAKDKKNIGNQVTVILTGGPGKMRKQGLNMDEIKRNIGPYLKGEI